MCCQSTCLDIWYGFSTLCVAVSDTILGVAAQQTKTVDVKIYHIFGFFFLDKMCFINCSACVRVTLQWHTLFLYSVRIFCFRCFWRPSTYIRITLIRWKRWNNSISSSSINNSNIAVCVSAEKMEKIKYWLHLRVLCVVSLENEDSYFFGLFSFLLWLFAYFLLSLFLFIFELEWL